MRLSGVRFRSNVPAISRDITGLTWSQPEVNQDERILMTIIRSVYFIKSTCDLPLV